MRVAAGTWASLNAIRSITFIPYRGSFVRRVGARVVHADVNQAVFFNSAEEYRIDHLSDDGDACVSLQVSHSQFSAAFTKMYGVAPSRHQSQLHFTFGYLSIVGGRRR